MEELVKKHYNDHIKTLWIFLITIIVLGLIATSSDNKWVFFFIFFSILGVIYSIKELIYYHDHFVNASNHLINWKYDNGDQLIITRWGLLQKISSPPELSVSYKFEGVSWELENLKDIAEVLVKNEGNLFLSMLPNINYSTTTNRIDEFISFSVLDTVKLIFIDYESGALIINIEKKNTHKKYTLTWPLESRSIEDEALNCVQKTIDKATPLQIIFIDKDIMEETLNS